MAVMMRRLAGGHAAPSAGISGLCATQPHTASHPQPSTAIHILHHRVCRLTTTNEFHREVNGRDSKMKKTLILCFIHGFKVGSLCVLQSAVVEGQLADAMFRRAAKPRLATTISSPSTFGIWSPRRCLN